MNWLCFNYKIYSLVFFFMITNFSLHGQSNTHSNQQWVQYYAQKKISDKFSLGGDVGFRWRNWMNEPAQYIARVSCWYKLNSGLKLGGGVVHSGFFAQDLANDTYFSSSEFRPYQEIGYDMKKEKFVVNFRYRLEERWFTQFSIFDQKSHTFLLRNRLAANAQFKLFNISENKETSLWWLIGNELFLNWITPDATGAYDQNRIMTGPVLKFSENLSLQCIYNLQITSSKLTNANHMFTHVIWASVRHSF
ncbi:MAG: DUF2490 domain-containing protein [Crocinitomicaceae bacterium]|nr:DUF2490 domain-containing protein [Crocinitomicaceae bacterium]MBK8927008.1 DUF2490 domain-containing protein [Crocinitomicaceae bacterium]